MGTRKTLVSVVVGHAGVGAGVGTAAVSVVFSVTLVMGGKVQNSEER